MAAIHTGLPGEAREEFTVCAEIYHLGLPDCFFRGGCVVSDDGTADDSD